MKFIREKKLLAHYFSEISQNTGRYCFGVQDTLHALDLGAVEQLIVWENLDITRFHVKNAVTGGSCGVAGVCGFTMASLPRLCC